MYGSTSDDIIEFRRSRNKEPTQFSLLKSCLALNIICKLFIVVNRISGKNSFN